MANRTELCPGRWVWMTEGLAASELQRVVMVVLEYAVASGWNVPQSLLHVLCSSNEGFKSMWRHALDFSFFLKNVCVRPLIGVVTWAVRHSFCYVRKRQTSARGFRSFSFEIFKTAARLRRDLLAISTSHFFDQTNKPKSNARTNIPISNESI